MHSEEKKKTVKKELDTSEIDLSSASMLQSNAQLTEGTNFSEGMQSSSFSKGTTPSWIESDSLKTSSFAEKMLEKDRYHILKLLGKGGMGVVELAYDRNLQREVALKKISRELLQASSKQENIVWRFSREATLTANLEHPSIVPIYDFQEKENQLYYTMKKLEGKTLRDYLRGEKTEEKKLLGILFKVAEGMAYAHAKGVIHRDLKPENIMIGNYGEVYILDWGIAKKLEDTVSEKDDIHTIPQEYKTIGGIGTFGYMPPEQMKNAGEAHFASDIYALGKMLREYYVGLSPWEEISRFKHLHQEQKNTEDVERAFQEELDQRIPKEIAAIVHKAIKENVEERYSHIQEFALDLERYLRGIPVSAQEYRLDELFIKWSKRNKKIISLVLILMILGLGAWKYGQWESERQKRKNYQEVYQEAIEQYQVAIQIHEGSREGRSQRMQKLLGALLKINKALIYYPNQRDAKSEKIRVGEELLKECYQGSDFELAQYVAEELEQIEEQGESKYKKEVNAKKYEQLTQHQQQLKAWIEKVKPDEKGEKKGLEEGEVQDFIFEVVQMKEPEIFEALMNEFREGSQIMLTKEQEDRFVRYEEYCLYIIEILGRLGNPTAVPEIASILKQTGEKIEKLPKQMQSLNLTNYMVELANALGNLKAESYWNLIEQIRWKMGPQSIFWNRTQLTNKKLLVGGLRYYTDLLSNNPLDSLAYFQRGRVKEQLNDDAGALIDCSEAIRLNPHYAEAYNVRGLVKKNLKNFPGALLDCTEALRLSPEYAEAYNSRGTIKKELKDFEGAIADYTEAILRNPTLASVYNYRGDAKVLKQDLEGALQDYTEAIRLNSQYAEAYNGRSVAHYLKRNYEEQKRDLDHCLLLNPRYAEAYSNRGNFKSLESNYEGAIFDYTEAIRLNPQLAQAYYYRGDAKKQNKQLEGAIKDFDEAIRLQPEYTEAYNGRGYTKYLKGDFVGAIQDLNEAIRLNTRYPEAYCNRGLAFANKGDLEKAIRDYDEALRLKPRYEQVLHYRGSAKANQGDLDGAIQDYDEAIQMNPLYIQVYNDRGVAYYQKNDLAGAIRNYDELIRINPQYIEVYLNRGSIKAQNKDLEGAIQDYTRALQLLEEERAIIDYTVLQRRQLQFQLYHQRGSALSRKGDLNEAIKDLEKGFALQEPGSAPQAIFIEVLLRQTKQQFQNQAYLEAKENLLKIKKYLTPDDPRIPQIDKKLQEIEPLLNEKK